MDIKFGLILLFSTFFIFSLFYIVRRDIFYGGVYLFLYIYIIFVLIGYKYLPELSIFIKAYFGPEIFIPLTLFVFASFISFFISFCSFYHKIQKKTYRVSNFLICLFSVIIYCIFFIYKLRRPKLPKFCYRKLSKGKGAKFCYFCNDVQVFTTNDSPPLFVV